MKSADRPVARHRWFDRRRHLDPADAAQRISAFLYGNILALAALVPFLSEDLTWRAVWVVLGTTASTYLAHVVAEGVGHDLPWSRWPHLMRESWPILTSGIAPALILGAGLIGLLPVGVVLVIAPVLVVVRLALTGVVVARLRGDPWSWRVVAASVGIAVAGLLVVVLKLWLTH